jgi:hypothetical protein
LTTAAVHAKVKTTRGCLRFGMKATYKEPRCANSGALFVRLLPEIPYNFKHLDNDRQMIAPAARMISSCLIPADGRKTTLSDGR